MVSDAGGIDDPAVQRVGVQGRYCRTRSPEFRLSRKFLESKSQTDYAPNITALVQRRLRHHRHGRLPDGDDEGRPENPEEKFAIVDAASDPTRSTT